MQLQAQPASPKGIRALVLAGEVPPRGFPTEVASAVPPVWPVPEYPIYIENFVVDTMFPIMISGILEVIDLQVLGSW